MAKGNLFLGMGRGKVGDVVFSRMNGEQISRVRNRNPKNPKTEAQMYQRAIMATTMQAYSAGKEIFDHSFEGKTVGEANMREFMKTNINILRSIVASEINGNVARGSQVGRVVPKGAFSPVPFAGMIVSKGTITNNFVTLVGDAQQPNIQFGNGTLTEGVGLAPAAFLEQFGVRNGDIFTIVAFASNGKTIGVVPNVSDDWMNIESFSFGFLRLIVNTNKVTGTISGSTTYGDLFDVEQGGDMFVLDFLNGNLATEPTLFINWLKGAYKASLHVQAAIIRSRRDIDVRSTEELVSVGGNDSYGIISSDILEAWNKDVDSLGGSELILEGGNF